MGFSMNCDRCGKFMKNVPMKAIREMGDNEIACKTCSDQETFMLKKYEKLSQQAINEIHAIKATLKDLLAEEVKYLLQKGKNKRKVKSNG